MTPSPTGLTPNLILRLESFALLAGAVAAYSRVAPDWLLFALLLFVPDVTMIGYLRDVRLGSLVYNLGHTLSLPILAAGIALALGSVPTAQLSLIWIAHIAIDRIMGYGLKYATTFKDTHMQHV